MARQFGAKLRQLREGHGLTQTDLAHRLGLTSRFHISNVETGQDRPSLDVVVRAAALFGVTVDELLRDSIPVAQVQSTAVGEMSHVGVNPVLLGQRVRTLRQQRGLTQQALAALLGPAGHSGIGKIERGEKFPSLERLVDLADALNTSVDALVLPDNESSVELDRTAASDNP